MENDEYVQSVWERVQPHLAVAAKTSGLRNLPKVSFDSVVAVQCKKTTFCMSVENQRTTFVEFDFGPRRSRIASVRSAKP